MDFEWNFTSCLLFWQANAAETIQEHLQMRNQHRIRQPQAYKLHTLYPFRRIKVNNNWGETRNDHLTEIHLGFIIFWYESDDEHQRHICSLGKVILRTLLDNPIPKILPCSAFHLIEHTNITYTHSLRHCRG